MLLRAGDLEHEVSNLQAQLTTQRVAADHARAELEAGLRAEMVAQARQAEEASGASAESKPRRYSL